MPLMGSGAYGPERDMDSWSAERAADTAALAAAAAGMSPMTVAAAATEAYAAELKRPFPSLPISTSLPSTPHTYPSGWWVDIREALNYELDEQGDAARHVGCTVDSRPFPVATGRSSGVTLEAFLIAVTKHRNACHGGQSE